MEEAKAVKGAKGMEEAKGAGQAKGAEETLDDATPLETGDSVDSATLSQLFLMKPRKHPVGRGLSRTCKN